MTKAKVKARKTGASKMSMGAASIVMARASTRPLPLDVAADINIDAARSSQSQKAQRVRGQKGEGEKVESVGGVTEGVGR